jgi:hypothetical protein
MKQRGAPASLKSLGRDSSAITFPFSLSRMLRDKTTRYWLVQSEDTALCYETQASVSSRTNYILSVSFKVKGSNLVKTRFATPPA